MEIYEFYFDYGNLPHHILVNIISRLKLDDFKNAVLTCKSWYSASCDRKITKQILINGLTDSSCIDYLRRPIQNIRLSAVNLNKFHFRKLLNMFGHTIRDLDILFPKLAITRIFEIFMYLSNIETVKIHFVSHYYSAQNYKAFKRIAKYRERIGENLRRIKYLTIHTRLHYLDPMQSFLSQCTNVEKLIFNEWIYLQRDQTPFICDFLLEPSRNPMIMNLKDLLIGCINSGRSNQIFMKLVSVPLVNLTHLHLKEISKENYDSVFRKFCQVYHFLDEFTINGCNDQHLSDICRYMKNLKSLGLDNSIAINFEPIADMPRLESLHINRISTLRDDKLLLLLNLKLKSLKKLSLNIISEEILKCLCENYTELEQLTLEGLDTKNCIPIFQHLTKLKVLNLSFMEPATCHSSRLQSCDTYNITRLTKLRELYVSCWVPGIAPSLVRKLQYFQPCCETCVYDPTEEEFEMWRLAAQERHERLTNGLNEIEITEQAEENQEYDVTDFNLNLYSDLLS